MLSLDTTQHSHQKDHVAKTNSNQQLTKESGSEEEVELLLMEEEEGLDVFWVPKSWMVGGGEETVLFSVWISL